MDILNVLERGSANVTLHDGSWSLRLSAGALLSAYDSYLGYSIVAASPQAERVLGAVMIMRPEVNASGIGPTVIFDVNVASGTLMARAVQRLRDRGNTSRLVGVALHSLLREQLPHQIDGLADFVVINPPDEVSDGRQPAQCGNRGIQLAS